MRLGLDPQRVHILNLGDLEPASATPIIHAVEQMRAWKIDVDLHIVGNAPTASGIAATLGIAEHVKVYGRAATDSKRNDWLAAVDLGVCLRSGNVGVPMELFEMLAAGIPTVATRELVQGFALPSFALEVQDVPSALLIAEPWRKTLEAGRHHERLTADRAKFVEERQPNRHARALLHLLKVA